MAETRFSIDKLRELAAVKDVSTFSLVSHNIKGAAANVSAHKLRKAAELANQAAKEEDIAKAEKAIPAIQEAFLELESALKKSGWFKS